MDLNAATALIAIMGLMQALFCVAWLVAGSRLKLSRESSFLWSGFCLCIAVGAGLFVHPSSHFNEILVLIRGVAIVLAATLLRRGVDAFLGLPRHTVESVVVVALYVLAAMVVGLEREAQQTRAVAQSAVVGWVLLRAVQTQVAPLRAEFGWPTAMVLCSVLAGIGLAFGGLGVVTALGLNPSPVDRPSVPNIGFLAALVVASALFNFLLGFLVVARVVRELQWQTRHDGLTGLYNRRAFDFELTREQQRCARRASRLAVLMVDVDHFKLINDSLGHSAGDAVLVAIAATLKRASRQTDVIGRVGGEEFALVLPDTDAIGAQLQAGRLRAAVENLLWPDLAAEMRVTVSIGVADWLAGADDGESPLQLADRALYLSKSRGRNRVEVLESGPAGA